MTMWEQFTNATSRTSLLMFNTLNIPACCLFSRYSAYLLAFIPYTVSLLVLSGIQYNGVILRHERVSPESFLFTFWQGVGLGSGQQAAVPLSRFILHKISL